VTRSILNDLRDVKDVDQNGDRVLRTKITNAGDISQLRGETNAAGENISAVKALYSNGTNVFLGDANEMFAEAVIVGISVTAATTGNEVRYFIDGTFYDSSFSFTDGEPVFLAENGNLTQTDPIALGYNYRTVVGFAIGVNGLNINIQEPIEI